MGKVALDAASARLCRAGHRSREAHATGGSGQTHVNSWIGGVDDHQGALERAGTTGSHLVADETAEQSSSTVALYVQTMLVRSNSRKER